VTRIAILGVTGSIGSSALAVVDAHPGRLSVVAAAAGRNVARMSEIVASYRLGGVAMCDDASLQAVRHAVAGTAAGAGVDTWASGRDGLVAIAVRDDVDVVLCASSGTEALEAVLAAIDAGKTIALANKEVLVMAGALVMERARARGVAVLPVDSEHNAIHQCLHGHPDSHVARLILTASGGPFRDTPPEALSSVTAEDALSHPTWKMGRKITIDSATLMNKGLEVIEAHWLFDVPAERIEVVIHPQSVVHSMVEFADGSVIAQLGVTDMKLPIQYAFTYPERWASTVPRLDWSQSRTLTFSPPDFQRFPCLQLAFDALRAGGAAPVVLNAANEVAVASFLERRLSFPGIAAVVAEMLDRAASESFDTATIEDIRAVDDWSRRRAAAHVAALQSRSEVSQ
jgi:1-deoxy-D-xylulose-5-phosphate reductoisomerase